VSENESIGNFDKKALIISALSSDGFSGDDREFSVEVRRMSTSSSSLSFYPNTNYDLTPAPSKIQTSSSSGGLSTVSSAQKSANDEPKPQPTKTDQRAAAENTAANGAANSSSETANSGADLETGNTTTNSTISFYA
jgi:hypothetical protein